MNTGRHGYAYQVYNYMLANQDYLDNMRRDAQYKLLDGILPLLETHKPLTLCIAERAEPIANYSKRYDMEVIALWDYYLDCEIGDYAVYRDECPWQEGSAFFADGHRIYRMMTYHFDGKQVQTLRREQ